MVSITVVDRGDTEKLERKIGFNETRKTHGDE